MPPALRQLPRLSAGPDLRDTGIAPLVRTWQTLSAVPVRAYEVFAAKG